MWEEPCAVMEWIPLIFVSLSLCLPICCLPQTERKPSEVTEFSSNRTKVSLSCDSDVIAVHVNFTEPFQGVLYAGPPKSSCKIRGDGGTSYILRVPLDDCGTCINHECSSGKFVNTLHIRYHPTLELEWDEIKTIICRFRTGTVRLGWTTEHLHQLRYDKKNLHQLWSYYKSDTYLLQNATFCYGYNITKYNIVLIT